MDSATLIKTSQLMVLLTATASCGFGTHSGSASAQTPDWNREIRPILAKKCFACHGPDEDAREADLRLDQIDSAIEGGVIQPRKPGNSELIHRIQSKDPDEIMPPPESGEKLSEEEIELLSNWVKSGAKHQPHWAFIPPVRPELPKANELLEGLSQDERRRLQSWTESGIDRLVLKELRKQKKTPAAKANRYDLIRRVYLDLIGLPPTPQQADEFVNDADPDAYQKVVEQLLASKSYGEKWARQWLDLARYADTNGYEKDRTRSIWPYRDWVIKALNNDMPFDQFTIEQLAGDMLPEATADQFIATGFHRNTMLNEEGGIDPLEYRYYAMVDRVATTGTVWLGLTTGCAQCHTHKYDPISHHEYFQLMAMMNNADEPDLLFLNQKQRQWRSKLQTEIETLKSAFLKKFRPVILDKNKRTDSENKLAVEFRKWLDKEKLKARLWETLTPLSVKTNLPILTREKDGSLFASGDFTKRDVYDLSFPLPSSNKAWTAIRLEVLPDDRLPDRGPGNAYYEGRKGDFFLSEMEITLDGKSISPREGKVTFGKISIGSGSAVAKNVFDGEGSTGWSTAGQEGKRNALILVFPKPITGDILDLKMIFERHFVASLGRFRISVTADEINLEHGISQLSAELENQIATSDGAELYSQESLAEPFLMTTDLLKNDRQPIEAAATKLPKPTRTMIFRERTEGNGRDTFLHHRGEYLSPREQVAPQLPRFLAGENAGRQMNRLQFARWLVSKENPLVARAAVNRAWQSFFGRGLVETPGDFGIQSSAPSHPKLLDWLAIEFQKDWSLKNLHRSIVLSQTYQQSSAMTGDDAKSDPENRWYSRGPRFRVNAEVVRDIALAASGKLSKKMYGPSVYPPQPKAVTALAYGGTRWPVSKGEDRFRRSLYTFSKRTAPFAAFQTFNGPTGESCVASRNRSNTPLQALTLLNDEMFFELARFAVQANQQSHPDADARSLTVSLFRRFLVRPPTEQETDQVLAFYQKQLQRLNNGELDPIKIAGKESSSIEVAWMLTARALMSLDEFITKP